MTEFPIGSYVKIRKDRESWFPSFKGHVYKVEKRRFNDPYKGVVYHPGLDKIQDNSLIPLVCDFELAMPDIYSED